MKDSPTIFLNVKRETRWSSPYVEAFPHVHKKGRKKEITLGQEDEFHTDHDG